MVVEAAKADSVQRAYTVDYCSPSNLSLQDTQNWFQKQIILWKQLSQSVKLAK
jgi:hypothetical protein